MVHNLIVVSKYIVNFQVHFRHKHSSVINPFHVDFCSYFDSINGYFDLSATSETVCI